MKSKSESNKTIKVLLLGTQEQKQNFKRDCGVSEKSVLSVDFFTVAGKSGKVNYQIWDCAGLDGLKFIPAKFIAGFQALVYCDAMKERQAIYEIKRDSNKCLAFDFNALNLKPLDFLDAIEATMHEHKTNIKALDQDKTKAQLLIQASKLKDTVFDTPTPSFSNLPMDVTKTIIQMMFQNHPIFTNPLKPIYIALPKADIKAEESVEPEESGCAIQ